MPPKIYLDHAATTPVDPRVLKAMRPFFDKTYGNPSSFHTDGLTAQRAVLDARERVARALNAHADEIIFTSGGTESDNLAITGAIRAHREYGNHVITSAIEHHAVLEQLERLAKRGEIELTVLSVDAFGRVDRKSVEKAITPKTVLISIMHANNEIGTIQPIAEIGRAILSYRKTRDMIYPLFHTDACQTAGALDLDVAKLHVDLLSLSAQKFYGPKGVGVLYLRRGLKIDPLIVGGGQERGLRAGTENVPGIIGLATALELAVGDREAENARLMSLRDRLITGLLKMPKTRLNGHPTERLPNNVNVSFLDVEGEAMILYLDAKGIRVSTGSACASTSLDPSHVILATGLSYEAAHGSVRFTLGHSTTREDIAFVLKQMPPVLKLLRSISPVRLDTEMVQVRKH
jgi:cysteine desulfurase